MRILHTSDWHLGHRLYDRDRGKEQQLALDWLLQTISEEAVDVLIVAGDIFDVGNPPNYAREQYFNFLARIKNTNCQHVIVVGGNHDSPSMLNAPAAVFKHFNIHVIGAATANPADQIIELKDPAGELCAVVAAVPFLRDRDLHYSQSAASVGEREKHLQNGIRKHYQQLADLVEAYSKHAIPILTTGHLYAHGASAEEKRSNIYIGNRSNIKAGDFPSVFDYVALGHIHRPQKVGKLAHVRYSGSLIPLDFSELGDQKQVFILDFIDAKSATKTASKFQLQSLALPTFRRLKQISGDFESVKIDLEKFLAKRAVRPTESQEHLPPWLEIKVQSDRPILLLREQLENIIGDRAAQLLAVKLERSDTLRAAEALPIPELTALDIHQVFELCCTEKAKLDKEQLQGLKDSFLELQNWHQEQQHS